MGSADQIVRPSTVPSPDAPPVRGRVAPVRTCVGCRRRATKASLLRVVASGGVVVPDPGSRLPGRGAYLHPSRRCLELAERRRSFPRALRVPGPLETAPVADYLSDRFR